MRASDIILKAIEMVERDSSPWRPELLAELNHTLRAAYLHESWIKPAPPRETASATAFSRDTASTTALGHHPTRGVVDTRLTATDKALEVLDCSD